MLNDFFYPIPACSAIPIIILYITIDDILSMLPSAIGMWGLALDFIFPMLSNKDKFFSYPEIAFLEGDSHVWKELFYVK